MGNSPKENIAKLQQILKAWEEQASGKKFGGMSLEEFRVIVNRCLAARARIDALEQQMTQAITERENADNDGLAAANLIVNGVRADPTEGADGALIEGMGYKRTSERKSGLHRTKGGSKKGGGTGGTP
jgi:hypothetical protein